MNRENIDPVQQIPIQNGIVAILQELVDFSSSSESDNEVEHNVCDRKKTKIAKIGKLRREYYSSI